jgi:hypothetical protein
VTTAETEASSEKNLEIQVTSMVNFSEQEEKYITKFT